MSRTKFNHPVDCYVCAISEKQDKRLYNRRMRMNENMRLRKLYLDFEPLHLYAYSDPWNMNKDDARHWLSKEQIQRCLNEFGWMKWIKK